MPAPAPAPAGGRAGPRRPCSRGSARAPPPGPAPPRSSRWGRRRPCWRWWRPAPWRPPRALPRSRPRCCPPGGWRASGSAAWRGCRARSAPRRPAGRCRSSPAPSCCPRCRRWRTACSAWRAASPTAARWSTGCAAPMPRSSRRCPIRCWCCPTSACRCAPTARRGRCWAGGRRAPRRPPMRPRCCATPRWPRRWTGRSPPARRPRPTCCCPCPWRAMSRRRRSRWTRLSPMAGGCWCCCPTAPGTARWNACAPISSPMRATSCARRSPP